MQLCRSNSLQATKSAAITSVSLLRERSGLFLIWSSEVLGAEPGAELHLCCACCVQKRNAAVLAEIVVSACRVLCAASSATHIICSFGAVLSTDHGKVQ